MEINDQVPTICVYRQSMSGHRSKMNFNDEMAKICGYRQRISLKLKWSTQKINGMQFNSRVRIVCVYMSWN